MLQRAAHLEELGTRLRRAPVVALLGARQVGKTTLARQLSEGWEGEVTNFDLEDPRDLSRLADPTLALQDLRGLVILDEVQRLPDLFPILRVLADRAGPPARFLVLGSAGPDLLRQSSESLAGRISYYELEGFGLEEVGVDRLNELWIRGGFPKSFLAESDQASFGWRRDFIRTFLERDLPQLGITVPSTTMRRFWTMLANSHGDAWNASQIGGALGASYKEVRRYLDWLTSAYVITPLQPWHQNLKKRQIKSPKVYLSDSGLLHALLGLQSKEQLEGHPKVGASWEGFAINVIRHRLDVPPEDCYFWGTHAGAELDLLVMKGNLRLGFEIKRTVAPKVTRSMRIALEDLELDRIDVVHAGDATFELDERLRALSLSRVLEDLEPF